MAQERSPEQGWDKGEGKAVKVAMKAQAVSGKPREGGDMKAKKESGGKMWHKKRTLAEGGETGSDSIRYCRESRKGWKVIGPAKEKVS